MTFADKLNALFESKPDPVRGTPYSNSAVAHAVVASGGQLSAPYLSQLRSGRDARVSVDVVVALAKFFNVSIDYFIEDDEYAEMKRSLDADDGAVEIANRSSMLSPRSRARVLALAETLRRAEEIERGTSSEERPE